MDSIICIFLFGVTTFFAGFYFCEYFLSKEIDYFKTTLNEIAKENQKLNFEILNLNHQLDLKDINK